MRAKRLIAGAIVFAGLVFTTNSALALFMLKPMELTLNIKRGESKTQVFTVRNDTEKSITCQIYATGYEVKKDGSQLFENAKNKYSVPEWVKIKESEFKVPASENKKLEARIFVPRTARPGEYFAVIMVEKRPGKVKRRTGISIPVIFRMACIAKITVPGRIIGKKAEISEAKVEVPDPESKEKKVKVIVTLRNKCQVHLDAQGEVRIKNEKGRVFDKFVLQGAGKRTKGEAFVYPEGERIFWGTIGRPFPPGEYIAEVSFNYGHKFRRVRAKESFTVTQAVSVKQKESLILKAQPGLLKYSLVPGGYHVEGVQVENMDPVEALEVTTQSSAQWLKVFPQRLKLAPKRRRKIRVVARIPRDTEVVKRSGKVMFKAEKGDPVFVDVIVSDARKKETTK